MKKTDNTDDGVLSDITPKPSKTPFYQAVNAIRYQRQALIKQINTGKPERNLICYISGDQAIIDRDDTVGFSDLLHNIPANVDLDLMLHTVGGDVEAAEKSMLLIREKVGKAKLRVIVPDFAKSAGTLMAIGADEILMSDTSELGPIDPQVILADKNGNRQRHSVQNYLDAYKSYSDMLKKDPEDIAATIMINKLDPATVKMYEAVMTRTRKIAEDQLRRGMFKETGNWSQAASILIDTSIWPSHAQMISWKDALDQKIGLKVVYLEPKSDEWQKYWQLYCLQRLAVGDRQKLFESGYASLCMDSRIN